jgi:cephalosporin hydroxylase
MERLFDRNWSRYPYAWSHGARDGYAGTGALYYALVYANRLSRALVLGTGGAFVPGIVWCAQTDAGLAPDVTIVDDLSGVGDEPRCAEATYHLMEGRQGCRWHVVTTEEYAIAHAAEVFDFVHIDANHEFEYALTDMERYWEMLAPGGYMTVHDTDPVRGLPGPRAAVDAFVRRHGVGRMDVWTGDSCGTTVIKKPQNPYL